jgi:hypothetical protein
LSYAKFMCTGGSPLTLATNTMTLIITLCVCVALIVPLIFFSKITAIYEQARLEAIKNGEKISGFYMCRGCSQQNEFVKKYTPHLRMKISIYSAGAALFFFIPIGIILTILSSMNN